MNLLFHTHFFSPKTVSTMVSMLLICLVNIPPAIAQTVSTLVGTGVKGFSGDGGPAQLAQLNNPFAIARGPDGAIYICDVDNHRIRRVDANGIITTFAGSAKRGYEGDGGAADQAALHSPYEIAWDKQGNMFFVDIGTHTVRRIDAKTKVISTIAGTGAAGFAGDGGPATQSQLNQPHSLAFDPLGRLCVCDVLNHRVRRIDLEKGTIETWGGNGEKKTSPDGTEMKSTSLHGPRAMIFTPNGTGWLALREGNALLRIDPQSDKIERVAGNGKSGFSGNGGPALQAQLAGPKNVSFDAQGNVFLADTESHSVRYYDIQKKTIEVLVGDGKKGNGPNGENPLSCRLARPHGVFVDQDGSILIGDSENHVVRIWKP